MQPRMLGRALHTYTLATMLKHALQPKAIKLVRPPHASLQTGDPLLQELHENISQLIHAMRWRDSIGSYAWQQLLHTLQDLTRRVLQIAVGGKQGHRRMQEKSKIESA
jgi:hypothetical protein